MNKYDKFPKGFLFGSGTSSHQIEGGLNNDWREFEKLPGHISDSSTSGIACDSWNKWQDDIELLKNSDQNTYRFSIEWSRVEPEDGCFNEETISRYRQILVALRKANIEPMVTLFHFTLPLWLAEKGGVINKSFPQCFSRFSRKIAESLGENIDLWSVLNEPNIYLLKGYIEGEWCPGQKKFWKIIPGYINFIKAHRLSYYEIKKIRPEAKIGIALNMAVYEANNCNNPIDRIIAKVAPYFAHRFFLNRIIDQLDFIGINHYMKFKVAAFKSEFAGTSKSDFGWGIFNNSLYEIIKENSHFKKPIYITENGIADKNDVYRPRFLEDAFSQLQKALGEGMPVCGYFYWSLLDNFEWSEGYSKKFGLFTIDRKARESVEVYKDLIAKHRST